MQQKLTQEPTDNLWIVGVTKIRNHHNSMQRAFLQRKCTLYIMSIINKTRNVQL